MLIWAVVNVVLSVLALGFALLNRSAPHRLRFHVGFIALLCWLVPWAQVPHWLPNLLSLDLWSVEKRFIDHSATVTNIPLIIIDTRNVPLANDVTLLHVPLLALTALSLIGLLLFAWNLLRHQLRLQALKSSARDGSHYLAVCGIEASVPVLLQNQINGAFSSGLFKPAIWVHEALADSDELPTLLRHELTHIEQHDNWYLLAITLVEKLFWWNPLVWQLGRQTRELQELSCDERCRNSNADYPAELAALMLSNLGVSRSEAQEPLLLSANIFNKANLDIQRLKVLQRTYQMKPRHIVCAVATAVLAVTTVGLVTAQPVSDQAPAGSLSRHLVASILNIQDTPDQFMRIEQVNGKPSITFQFSDAPLRIVLAPLANMLGAPDAEQFMMLSAHKDGYVPGIFMMIGGPGGSHLDMAKLQTQAKSSFSVAEKPNWIRSGDLAWEPVRKQAADLQSRPAFNLPLSNKLQFEYAGAKTRQVTIGGESLSVEEAIAKIADASQCNIFKDKDTIVVDYCKPQ